jgi:hypothetical protein
VIFVDWRGKVLHGGAPDCKIVTSLLAVACQRLRKKNMASMSDSTQLQSPERRPLRVFAFDPSRRGVLGNKMQIEVRYRKLGPGPIDQSGARDQIAVVDYDASRGIYYRPVNLDEPFILIPNGIAPSEADPRFHQQMLYAIASDTIEQFESALGRRIHWRRAERPLNAPPGWHPEDILTLTLYPHAMQQANAFYSPEAHGILFGYFKAARDNPGHNLPGQSVFTCLSHDIIVHETTHAILDGLRSHFMEQTNPDVAAFHEAFADLAALFRHFTHREVLLDVIQRTGGRLYSPALQGDALADQAAQSWLSRGDEDRNPLVELAGQFGEAIGMRSALRSAIGKPKTMKQLRDTSECHERGSILVAAVFDAFFTVYLQRAARHFRIYRAAGGREREDLPAPLADALCEVAAQTATDFFRTCARALDYLAPVDVTFGDFLRAVMTSETDFDPVDNEGIRDAWMQAFRCRGILPEDAPFFSEEALCWPARPEIIEVKGLPFGGPLGLSYNEQQQTAAALAAFIDTDDHKELLGLDPGLEYAIPSFHPLYRMNRSGEMRWDLVVEVIQTQVATPATFPRRGGTTMIISTHSTGGGGKADEVFLRYSIAKRLQGAEGRQRAERQAGFLDQQGFRPGGTAAQLRVNFALVHGGD